MTKKTLTTAQQKFLGYFTHEWITLSNIATAAGKAGVGGYPHMWAINTALEFVRQGLVEHKQPEQAAAFYRNDLFRLPNNTPQDEYFADTPFADITSEMWDEADTKNYNHQLPTIPDNIASREHPISLGNDERFMYRECGDWYFKDPKSHFLGDRWIRMDLNYQAVYTLAYAKKQEI